MLKRLLQPIKQLASPFRVTDYVVEKLLFLGFCHFAIAKQLHRATNGSERRLQFMGNVRSKGDDVVITFKQFL